jgi:hypothetical protein
MSADDYMSITVSTVLKNKILFLDKFKSRLYSFQPGEIVLSDNSRPSGKREAVELSMLRTGCGSM